MKKVKEDVAILGDLCDDDSEKEEPTPEADEESLLDIIENAMAEADSVQDAEIVASERGFLLNFADGTSYEINVRKTK